MAEEVGRRLQEVGTQLAVGFVEGVVCCILTEPRRPFPHMGKVHTQLTSHYLVIVEVADRRRSSICIRELSEAKTFRLAGIVVVDKSKC